MNNALREYVTRINFNLSLTRNQIDAFERIAFEVAYWEIYNKALHYNEEMAIGRAPNFVVASRKLCNIGLVTHLDPSEMSPPWSKCVWTITTAGHAVYTLLIEAGLVSKPNFKVKIS